MALNEKIEKLAAEKSYPNVTISLNTHRTHPDNLVDEIELKNLLKEAEERVIQDYGKRFVAPLLKKISTINSEIHRDYLLDSLHIFLSNETKEIFKLSIRTPRNVAYVDEEFHINPLIKACNRTDEYYILLLSQSGVHLYIALNDRIEKEIENKDFPFGENPYYIQPERKGDAKYADDMVREFFNDVDKALVRLYNQTGLETIVICTEDNYSRLMQVADKAEMYLGYEAINYNNTTPYHIAKQAWEKIQAAQYERRRRAIEEVKESVSTRRVITDLQDIYRAAIDGKGDLLIVNEYFSQPVKMKDERSFELREDATKKSVIDDITGVIAWEVLSKGGRVVFTRQEELLDLGNIVLKTRY